MTTTTPMSVQTKPSGASLDSKNKALFWLDDLMARCVLDAKYVLLGETAKAIREDKDLPDVLEAGLDQRYLTKEVMSTLKTYVPGDFTEAGFVTESEGVPVHFKFIKRKFAFLQNPDIRFYGPEEYQIPNPFDGYWKSRGLVQ